MKKRWLLPVFAAFMIFASPVTNEAEAASYNELKTTASKYIGTPYVYGGTTTRGFDCSGYTQRVFSDLGIKLNRTSSSQYSQGTAVTSLVPGDLVFFNTSGRGISHVGIYIGNNQFIHSSTSKGVIISGLSENYWSKRYVGAKRVATFTEEQVKEVKAVAVDFSVYASRAEVAIQLADALGLDTTDTNANFADVKATDRYAGAANALQKIGVFEGDQNGKFNPNSPITRAEISKVLVTAYDLQMQGSETPFSDVKPTNWAHDYIQVLASNGITKGIGEGKFGATGHVTLTQLKTFIERAQ